ncbi:MAG: PCMD domain-containing protein [Bacteroidales bacterium]|nr:PCMD domain-containing protein [Bacteroidales bacterium]
MKKILIVSFIILLVVVSACDNKDPIENIDNDLTNVALAGGDFENWTEFSQGELTYFKPSGDWWDGLNYLAVIGGPVTYERTSDSYQGDYALRLETKAWGEDLTIPGILASGYFDPDQTIGENLMIGKPYDKTPTRFNGFIKYQPADNDTLVVFLALTKYDVELKKRDTIATAEYTNTETMETYTPFNVDINYRNQTTPDSIHVILLASVSGKEMKGHEGSVLFVDQLSLTYE